MGHYWSLLVTAKEHKGIFLLCHYFANAYTVVSANYTMSRADHATDHSRLGFAETSG